MLRLHCQNLTEGKQPLWKSGRCWYYPRGEDHSSWGAEWHLLHRWWQFSVGIEKGGYEPNRICGHISIPGLSLYLHRSFRRMFEHRSLSITFFMGDIQIDPWCDSDEWSRSRPWYRQSFTVPVSRWIWGTCHYSKADGLPIEVLVPMPEGCYRGTAKPYQSEWRWRFGRKKRSEGWSFDFGAGGIPFAGNGESSWDCGDDGLCGISCEGTLEEGIGKVVASVLASRKRYGNASFVKHQDVVMAKEK